MITLAKPPKDEAVALLRPLINSIAQSLMPTEMGMLGYFMHYIKTAGDMGIRCAVIHSSGEPIDPKDRPRSMVPSALLKSRTNL